MNETKGLLERVGERFTFPDDMLERVERRRGRKRRNQRLTAVVVGIAVFVAGVWFVRDFTSLDSTPAVVPGVSGATGPSETGPSETGPSETGPSETGPAEAGSAALVSGVPTDYLLDLETGETTPLPKEIRGIWQNGYALSPDGSEVAYYGTQEAFGDIDQALFVADIDGTDVRQIADDAALNGWGRGASGTGPAWSPDGTKIAYTARPSGDGNANVFVLDLATGVKTQVTFETVDVSGAEFSPDGSSIVYTALLPGGNEVRIAPATGGEGSTLVEGHGSSASNASFSPDGSLLSYICGDPPDDPTGPGDDRDLCLANADGSDARMIARPEAPNGYGRIVTASWSPDGSRLAFWTFDGVEGVYILDLATGQTTCVVGCEITGESNWPLGAWPRWWDDHTLLVEAYKGPH